MTRGFVLLPVVESEVSPVAPAARVRGLEGLTIGLLENSKPQADVLLDHIGDLLVERHGAARIRRYAKPVAGQPMPEDLLGRMRDEVHAAVTGVGD